MAANQFGFNEVPGSDLQPGDVPRVSDGWDAIFTFALSYDGYAHYGDRCADMANHAADDYSGHGRLPDLVDELRACLFFEQRRWRHFGETPNEEARRHFDALLEAIRQKVQRGQGV
ncbi:MAG: hypothetical protein RQ731_08490 [Anaerosomatales bacterium]|nr:hypothetical protein [Anaerosomatales bacterium]MDT8434776.1 hypothetical protein [Anaerosomatales bacterium]